MLYNTIERLSNGLWSNGFFQGFLKSNMLRTKKMITSTNIIHIFSMRKTQKIAYFHIAKQLKTKFVSRWFQLCVKLTLFKKLKILSKLWIIFLFLFFPSILTYIKVFSIIARLFEFNKILCHTLHFWNIHSLFIFITCFFKLLTSSATTIQIFFKKSKIYV